MLCVSKSQAASDCLLDESIPASESPLCLLDLAAGDTELLPPHLERDVHLEPRLDNARGAGGGGERGVGWGGGGGGQWQGIGNRTIDAAFQENNIGDQQHIIICLTCS